MIIRPTQRHVLFLQGSNFSLNLRFVCDILWKYQPAGWQKASTYNSTTYSYITLDHFHHWILNDIKKGNMHAGEGWSDTQLNLILLSTAHFYIGATL